MAFLDSSNPQVVEESDVEYRSLMFGDQKRTVTTYRLTWAIDDAGGESPPSTYSGADLMHAAPEIEYGGQAGLYVAVYRNEGSWVDV